MDGTALWVRAIKHSKIVNHDTEPCDHGGVLEALQAVCQRMDLARPIWLEKNQREWDEFSQTRFLPSQFMEPVNFDRLEIEFINPKAAKKKSMDPRNG